MLKNSLGSIIFAGLLLAGVSATSGEPLPDTLPAGGVDSAAQAIQQAASAIRFDETRTTHQVSLSPNGGLIEVIASNPQDSLSIAQIRRDLPRLAAAFSWGEFDLPWKAQELSPALVASLLRQKSSIHYQYQDAARGGVVSITSSDPEAIRAIQLFLQAQTASCLLQCGDSLQKQPAQESGDEDFSVDAEPEEFGPEMQSP